MKGFDLLIFDLDGTLVDSSDDIVTSMNYTLRELGLEEMAKPEIMNCVGFGSEFFIRGCLRGRDELLDDTRGCYMKYYMAHLTDKTTPFDGVEDTLRQILSLDKKHMVVFSNRGGNSARKILDLLRLSGYFKEVIGDKDGFELKPDPKTIGHWLDKFSVPKDEALMIGDSAVDIEAGKAAGIKTCLAKFGYGRYHDGFSEVDADYSIGEFRQLLEII
ncbi:MAG: HAD family hydrolase [Candidatus Omnitrophica bacterium]|nr:HAD family hydrolase [Candidatus Omnitrophota bacterium]